MHKEDKHCSNFMVIALSSGIRRRHTMEMNNKYQIFFGNVSKYSTPLLCSYLTESWELIVKAYDSREANTGHLINAELQCEYLTFFYLVRFGKKFVAQIMNAQKAINKSNG